MTYRWWCFESHIVDLVLGILLYGYGYICMGTRGLKEYILPYTHARR